MASYPYYKNKEEKEKFSTLLTDELGVYDIRGKTIEEIGEVVKTVTGDLDYSIYVACYFYDPTDK